MSAPIYVSVTVQIRRGKRGTALGRGEVTAELSSEVFESTDHEGRVMMVTGNFSGVFPSVAESAVRIAMENYEKHK